MITDDTISWVHHIAYIKKVFPRLLAPRLKHINTFRTKFNKLVCNRIGIMMYKHSNNLLLPAINDLYVSNNDVQKYSTKTKHLLYIHKSSIHVYAKKVFFRV